MPNTSQILPSTFRRRITIMRPVTLQDAAGGIGTSSYTTDYTTWAYIESLSSNRKAAYGLDVFDNAWLVIMRYTTDRVIKTNTIIQYGTSQWIVKTAQLQVQDYKRFWTLICLETGVQ